MATTICNVGAAAISVDRRYEDYWSGINEWSSKKDQGPRASVLEQQNGCTGV